MTTGRDDEGRVIWHEALKRFACELEFKPEINLAVKVWSLGAAPGFARRSRVLLRKRRVTDGHSEKTAPGRGSARE